IDREGGQVTGIDYDTPADRAALLAESGLDLSPDNSLLDLLRGLRGWRVRLERGEGTALEQVTGQLLGVEVAPEYPTRRALVAVWDESTRSVVSVLLGDLRRFSVLEDRPARDVQHFLDTSRSEEARRTVTVRLSGGEHDLSVSYLVPSPSWRVSYRLVADPEDGGAAGDVGPEGGPAPSPAATGGKLLLQGWGLFDNRLDEDLVDVAVTLVAGQPISFVYDLASSRIPERAVVQDEARVAAAPVEFAARLEAAPRRLARARAAAPMAPAPAAGGVALAGAVEAAGFAHLSADEVSRQAVAATGSDLGELFQYQ